MMVKQVFVYLGGGQSNDEPDRLFTLNRSPGLHQVLEEEDELQLTPEDTMFLHQLKICEIC